jgi:hypothetical protein
VPLAIVIVAYSSFEYWSALAAECIAKVQAIFRAVEYPNGISRRRRLIDNGLKEAIVDRLRIVSRTLVGSSQLP